VVVDIPKISGFSAPEEILGYLIRVASFMWRRRLNSELEKIGLNEIQFVVLMGIGWTGSIAIGDLSAFCRITKPLTSQVLASLERKKLVHTSAGDDDRRVKLAALTPAGESKLLAAVHILKKADDAIWSREPALAARLKRDLKKVIGDELFYDTPRRQPGPSRRQDGEGRVSECRLPRRSRR